MRCTQPMGLPLEAHKFLEENAKKIKFCEHCKRHNGYVSKVVDKRGMFDDMLLCQYELENGDFVTEVVQEEIWSSGPMIWLKLVDKDGKDLFVWPKSEFEEYL